MPPAFRTFFNSLSWVGCITVGVLLLAPGPAMACSVCFNAGGDASLSAYLGTAAFLSLLPFTMVLLVVRWIRRQQ